MTHQFGRDEEVAPFRAVTVTWLLYRGLRVDMPEDRTMAVKQDSPSSRNAGVYPGDRESSTCIIVSGGSETLDKATNATRGDSFLLRLSR